MKIRLSQSNSGSTVDRARRRAIDLLDHTFLQALHFCSAGVGFVIVAPQMKEAVHYVETQLVLKRCPEGARVAARRFRTDHDLAMLKRDDVCRASLIKEAAVKVRNPPIGYQSDAHLAEPREAAPFSRSKFQAFS
jgi:hypothetical protein